MGGDAPAFAAKAASTTIPIVFAVTADPVKAGLVSSLNRPGGNITGVNFLLNTIAAKLFEVLNETVPKATTIGFLVNPSGPEAESAVSEVSLAAQAGVAKCRGFPSHRKSVAEQEVLLAGNLRRQHF